MCGQLLFKSVKFLLFLAIGLVLFEQIQGRTLHQSRELVGNRNMRLCERRIWETLRMFCASLKNNQMRGKRSNRQITWEQMQNEQSQNEMYEDSYNMLSDQPQMEPLGSRNQGIVGECCYNSEYGCNDTQLKRYCDIHLDRGVTIKRPYFPTTTTPAPQKEQSSWLPWLALILNGWKKPESLVVIAETESADNTPTKEKTPVFGVPTFVSTPLPKKVEDIIEDANERNAETWTPTFGKPPFGGNQHLNPSIPLTVTDAPINPEIGFSFGFIDGIHHNVKK